MTVRSRPSGPVSVQSSSPPSKATSKAARGKRGVRPAANDVGWPRSAGAGDIALADPAGSVTVCAPSLR